MLTIILIAGALALAGQAKANSERAPANWSDGPAGASQTGRSASVEGLLVDITRVLVDFSESGETNRWNTVNDGVMGGLSQSRLSSATDTTAVFEGVLSLENNGGFASVRRAPTDYFISGATAIEVEVKGDGRRYQFRVRTNDGFDGVAYRAFFDTAPDEWRRVEIPLSQFRATYRGRSVPDAPQLDPAKIRQLGFLLGDKRPGPFRLEVRTVRARE